MARLVRRETLIAVLLPCFLGLTTASAQGPNLPANGRDQEPITLQFVVWDGVTSLPHLRKAISGFEKLHPNIQVNLQGVNYNTFFQKLLTQFAAGVAPDIAMMDPNNFQKFAKRGVLLPLQPFFNSTPGFNIDDYYPEIVRTHSWNGNLYVLPRDIAPIGLIYYNKRLFDEAHIPYPDGSWTWDFKIRPELKEKDFFWVVQQLTKLDERGKPVQYGYTPFDPGAIVDMMCYEQGARYANDPEHPTKLLYSDPRIVKVHQFVQDIYLHKHWSPSPSELSSSLQATAVQLFTSQRTAMYQCGIWDSSPIREDNKPGSKDFFDWDIAMAPAYKDGTRAYSTGGSGYGIVSSTPHPQEAWELVTWMAGAPGMTEMAQAGIAQPAIRKLAIKAPWVPNSRMNLDEQYPRNRIITDTEVKNVVFAPTADYWPEVSTYYNSKRDSIWTGILTPEEGLKEASDLGDSRLKDILKDEHLPKYSWIGGWLFAGGLALAIIGWVYLPERRRLLGGAARHENRVAYVFLMPWIIGILVFTLGPMLLSLLMGFADWDIITPARWRGAGNYAEMFTKDPRFWKSLWVTLVYTVFSVPLGMIVSLALALLLNVKVRGIAFYRTCFYLPALSSTVASALIWRKIFSQDSGLLNLLIYGPNGDRNIMGLGAFLTHLSGQPGSANWFGSETLALPTFILISMWTVGAGMVILLAGLQSIPQFYYEAATLDGASSLQRFKSVTLPLLSPSLFFVLVTGVIGSFQVFTTIYVITSAGGGAASATVGGPNDATRVLMIHLFDQAFMSLRMGYASAMAWVLFIIIMIFTLIQFRLNRQVYYEADLR